MHARLGSVVLIVVAAWALPARAQSSDPAQCGTTLPACTTTRTSCCTRAFESTATQKAILIPTDLCHQQFSNNTGVTGPTVGDAAPQWCADNPGPHTNAQSYMYGLVYRLMQNKIPVYWIVNPTKAPSTYGVTATSFDAQTKDVDFWVLSSAATPPAPTGSLTNGAGAVKLLTPSNVGLSSLAYATVNTNRNEFPIRGGAFMIAAEDRAAFDAFMQTQLGRSSCGSTQDCYNFIDNNGTYLYELQPGAKLVWQDYTQPLVSSKYVETAGSLPVALRIDYAPPKVAFVTNGSGVLHTLLAKANLDDIEVTVSCTTGAYTIPGVIGCDLDEAEVVSTNRLVTTVFNNAWVDLPGPGTCSTFATKLQAFATAAVGTKTGGNLILFGRSIDNGETCSSNLGALLGRPSTGLSIINSSVTDSDATPFIVRYPSNLLAQYGDMPLNLTGGNSTAWDRVSGSTDLYNPAYSTGTGANSLHRLITQEQGPSGNNCSNHGDLGVVGAASTAGCDSTANDTTTGDYRDIFAYGRYLDDKRNGVVFYSPGDNTTATFTRSHLKLILGSLLAVPPFLVEQVFTNIEVTRSSPIVALVGGQASIVQGSFEYHYNLDGTDQYTVPRTSSSVSVPADVSSFSFPALIGHLRGIATASIDTTVLDLGAGTSTLHASAGEGAASTDTFPAVVYTGCSPPYNGSCRAVWTTATTGLAPASEIVQQNNTTVSTLMLPEAGFAATNPATGNTYRADFVKKILKGYDTGTGYVAQLGGIDRSTVAVIGPGTSIGLSRPTIAYVGATDGMVHAICASVTGGCLRVGMELWAYIPRTNLPQLRFNVARVDGSPHVVDVRSVTLGLKTVLLIQAGTDPTRAGSTPAIYALDVSDPSNPSVLWEYATFDPASTGAPATPVARPTNGLGLGLTLAGGDALIASVQTNIVIAQTNNGGTGSNGNYVVAINAENGQKVWEHFNAYPSTTLATGVFAPRTQPTIDIPASAIPPGAVPIDKTISGSNGFMTDIIVADLYGNLWVLDPTDGTSKIKDTSLAEIPLFQFTTDYHSITKPAIYTEGGIEYAVFTTGGYADYTTSPLWGLNSGTQYMLAVNLNANPTTPLNETSAVANIPINETLVGIGFSQARVVGDQIFVTTDTGNINAATFGANTADTGHVYGYNVSSNSAITTIAQTHTGASSVVNDGLDLFSSSGGKRQQLKDSGTGLEYDAGGGTGERTSAVRQVTDMTRKLWLRTE